MLRGCGGLLGVWEGCGFRDILKNPEVCRGDWASGGKGRKRAFSAALDAFAEDGEPEVAGPADSALAADPDDPSPPARRRRRSSKGEYCQTLNTLQ